MPDIELKIKKIQNSVLRSVRAEEQLLSEETKKYRAQELEKTGAEVERRFGTRLEERRRALEAQAREEISKATLEAQQKLTGERNELTDRIFDTVTQRWTDFCKTKQYSDFLKKNIANALEQLQMRQPVLLLCKRDLALGEKLSEDLPVHVKISADEMMFLGGFKLLSMADGVILDRSYETLIAQQREKFRTYCTLSIR